LSPEQQIRLRSIAALVDVPRGGLIFGEGNPADFLFVMARGMARISRVSLSGRRQVMAFKMAGDLLGYPEQGIYVNTGRALSIVTIYRIPWRKLSVLLRRDPEMHASFLTRMAFDVRQAQKRIMALGQQNWGDAAPGAQHRHGQEHRSRAIAIPATQERAGILPMLICQAQEGRRQQMQQRGDGEQAGQAVSDHSGENMEVERLRHGDAPFACR
jgi:CRP-like cAMP-binding protein